MGIEIKGNNNGMAVEGNVTIGELNLEFGKGITSAKSVNVQEVEDAVVIEEQRPSWEEAIPEYLRTGKLLVAWNKLRDAGLLDKDYHLAKNVSKAAANYIVMGFCDGKKKKEWKPFEEFWGLTNLKVAKGQFSKEQNETISQIFMNL